MLYVIKRLDQGGGYVAPEGSPSSYVRELQRARQFGSREWAQQNACGNERVLSVEEAMQEGR